MKIQEILAETRLDELFNSTYDWNWDDDRGVLASMVASKIEVPDQEYSPSKLRTKFKNIAATFNIESGDTIWVMFLNGGGNQWEVVFDSQENKLNKEKTFSTTDAGNASKVLATVMEIIKTFTDQYNPTVMQFAAGDRKRTAIYTAMAQKFKGYKDYKFNVSKNADGRSTFVFYNY